MTTSANPAPIPTDPGASPSQLSEIWRAIGRLEGTSSAILDGQRELNRRIDRLFYTTLGVGGAIIVAVLASNFIGN